MRNLDKYRYEYASHRVEELLPLVTEDMPATHPLAMELAIMSDVIIAYEKKHYPIGRPTTAQIIQMSLEENGLSQKDLAQKIGVSPSRPGHCSGIVAGNVIRPGESSVLLRYRPCKILALAWLFFNIYLRRLPFRNCLG